MATNRRWGPEAAETRSALLDAAEKMMREDGYAAVTSRSLAKAAGLSPQIVYYYFRTMDDLYAELFRRSAEYYLKSIEEAKNASEPLLAMWELSVDPSRAAFVSEFIALASHRKFLKSLIAEFGAIFHARQSEIIATEMQARGLENIGWPSEVLAAVMEMTARGFAAGSDYGEVGLVEARDFVARRIKEFLQKPREPLKPLGNGASRQVRSAVAST